MNRLKPHSLLLCSGTLSGRPFSEKVAAARAGGFDGITLWMEDLVSAREEGLKSEDMRSYIADNGLVAGDLDALLSWLPEDAGGPPADDPWTIVNEQDFMDLQDAMGGVSLNCVHALESPVNMDLAADALGGLCDRLANRDMIVTVEFLPWAGIPDINTAYELISKTGRSNAAILFDTWHFFRGPSTLDDLRAIPGERIGSLQINDAPDEAGPDIIQETMNHRLMPGEGDIPLVEILQILHANGCTAPIGAEIFSETFRDIPAIEVGKRCGDALRNVLAKAGHPAAG
jgi:sugar phosphate isomerase/epimerase